MTGAGAIRRSRGFADDALFTTASCGSAPRSLFEPVSAATKDQEDEE
jgi:hypothetical protein